MSANSQSAGDDTVLVRRLQAGEEEAFERLVRTHAGPLLAVARRFLGSEDEARDAVQDAFISAFRSLDQFEEGARLSTWLHRIAVNAALMRLRSHRRRPEDPIEDLLPKFDTSGTTVEFPREWKAPAQVLLEREETRSIVRRKIEKLPEKYRIVLLLRDIEERDTGETAQLLGLSTGAVKVRLHRARLALRTLLAAQFDAGVP
jgi:RNA polymerase sigma-70 factor (ECF subfamily)